ncbi:MAG TPA: ABC transporter ATP-binding protein [Archaeoglobus veneficus]|nr:ABC transporter ATP-binding protein [Archaeoglobus veneficus]
MLVVKNVSKTYNSNVVLKDVSLELKKRILGIVGPNGSGKSTLLRIIAGLEKPSCGKILFRDKDITRLNANKRVELGIVYAFQIPRPFYRLTVLENVMIGCLIRNGENIRERAIKICKMMGIDHLINAKAKVLSQGELKLLELARVIATEPEIILLDEPFAALDKKNAKVVKEKLLEFKRMNYRMLITAHRFKILRDIADGFVEIKEGKIRRYHVEG